MNSIRISDNLPKVWLEVNVTKTDEYGHTVSSMFFDGTPFTIHAPHAKVEIDQNDASKGLLQVGRVGAASGYVEIVLPAPALNFGHNVRVSENQLVKEQKPPMPTKYKKGN